MSSSPFDPTTLFSLAGRVALITGGSLGIGAMIAEGFVAAGAQVLIAARDAAALSETASRLGRTGPGSCEPVVADLGSDEGARRLAEQVVTVTGAVDILVHNAGATALEAIELYDPEVWDRVMHLNVMAVHHLTGALLPLLEANAAPDEPSRIIVIGSTSGIAPSGLPDFAYGASKAAVHMLVRMHAAALAPRHILVNAIAPGLFPTRMSSFLQVDALRQPVLSTIPLGRPGRAEEIAGAAVFLASRAGGYTTGEVLVVDGGRTGIGRADPVAGL